MWMELMSSPVCVIVYRHPARVALRLAHHANKGVFAKLGAGGRGRREKMLHVDGADQHWTRAG
jgi:hypothetical protein